jgi:hypothetical protein
MTVLFFSALTLRFLYVSAVGVKHLFTASEYF